MILFLSILFSTLLIFLLCMLDPIIAAIVFAGFVLGCLFRGLYLVKEIHAQIVGDKEKDKVQAAVNRHLKERELKGIKEG